MNETDAIKILKDTLGELMVMQSKHGQTHPGDWQRSGTLVLDDLGDLVAETYESIDPDVADYIVEAVNGALVMGSLLPVLFNLLHSATEFQWGDVRLHLHAEGWCVYVDKTEPVTIFSTREEALFYIRGIKERP